MIDEIKMEKELECKIFFENNYLNKNDMEREIKEYISDLKSKYPLAIVTREFHKGKNVLVRATEIKSRNNLKEQDRNKEIEIDDWYIRQRGGR